MATTVPDPTALDNWYERSTDNQRWAKIIHITAEIPDDEEGVDGPTETYMVSWDMHIDAASPEDAARQALGIMRDPYSLATVFTVSNDRVEVTIDVVEEHG